MHPWETADSLNESSEQTLAYPSEVRQAADDDVFGAHSASERLANIESLLADPNTSSEEVLSREAEKLATAINADIEGRKLVVERFIQTVGTEEGTVLAAALGGADDPDVESEVVRLAEEVGTPTQRIAALEILGQSASQSPTTRAALLGILDPEIQGDEQVTAAALLAFGRRGVTSISEQENVIGTIKPFVQSGNPRVREHSLRVLAEWSPHDELLLQALTAATQDPDTAVRSSAIRLLGNNGFRFDDVRNAIITRLQDPQEEHQVRMTAWQVLESFPLDDQAYALYGEFKNTYSSAVPMTN
ncbi:MAG: HEAT repeat domain-containing protein [Gammaproteobacteria bacterium]